MNIQLRHITPDDLPFCGELVRQAGWNQIDADWMRVMKLDPYGCFLAEMDGSKAGTIVFTRFPARPENDIPAVAWISMVLVDQAFRGKGLGTEMFRQVLDRLGSAEIHTIRLDATDLGLGLYRKFGFREEYHLIRMIREEEINSEDNFLTSTTTTDSKLLADFDAAITRTNRHRMIDALHAQPNTLVMHRKEKNHSINGYVCVRPGRTGSQIGPCIADRTEVGLALLDQVLKRVGSEKLIIDIPVKNKIAVDWAHSNHFTEQRRFIRMYKGRKPTDRPENIFAGFGPEKG